MTSAERAVLVVAYFGGTEVLAATLYGIAALWAVAGRGGWLARCLPLALLLAALAPIGAYELLAQYSTQAGVVVVVLLAKLNWPRLLAQFQGSQTPAIEPTLTQAISDLRPQFLLRDVLKAVFLAGAVLAIVRHGSPSDLAKAGGTGWTRWIVAGAALGMTTLAAAWAISSNRRLYFWVIAFVVLTAAIGGVLDSARLVRGLVSHLFIPLGLPVFTPAGVDVPLWWLLLFALRGTMTAAILLLLRRSGWAAWNVKSRVTLQPVGEAVTTYSPRDRTRLVARAAICGFSILAAFMLVSMYRALLPPGVAPLEPLPNPNGYNDIVRAAAALNWAALPFRNAEEATVEECGTFVQVNAAALVLMRAGFTKPCRRPFEYTPAFYSLLLVDVRGAQALQQALTAEEKAANGSGKTADAAKIDLDMVRLAQAISRGGLVIDYMVADRIERSGLQLLAKELPSLDTTTLPGLSQALEEFDNSREPLDVVVKRTRVWDGVTPGWAGRLDSLAYSFSYHDDISRQMSDVRERNVAQLRLLVAEIALRQYILANGSPPESLAALVPKYLSAVPVDPYNDEPLVYRRTAERYLLYSVGFNRIDDGGHRASPDEARKGNGDLFFNTRPDMLPSAPASAAVPDPQMDAGDETSNSDGDERLHLNDAPEASAKDGR